MNIQQDIERKRGDTKKIVFRISSDGSPVNISSGYSFLLTADPEKAPVDDTNNIFQLSGVIVDGQNGRVGFPLTDQEADKLGSYYYDVQMVDPNSEKSTIVSGKIKFTQDITKS